ncbi:unnamed protein product [Rotaria magnacalcarata]|uniref:C2 domain-containing protein n=2 Tax=Rotaria magnacalcarata TaxID=392030 RepID=A0A816R4N3_9BILA|nr:unnamed protein product [Rotaria magnacalcarata]CAF1644932.1 unnamed protein product [Rotaria magnacalcarata]CAF2068133.1 unnamed protein product [Rotaria magnacalcarata]CAF2115249.1 unnamed protein product [Rotaria magnacalcarata]CAF2257964.1 unnamed protein product [Rotaria magnacalcarata]
MNAIVWSLIVGSCTLLWFLIIIALYLQRKSNRTSLWQSSAAVQSVISSAPISRRSSSSCLINLEKQQRPLRSRSASFGEDLTARLQILASGTSYRSYSPATIHPASRTTHVSLSGTNRCPIVSTIFPIVPVKPTVPAITFQLRYEQTTETLFISILQLNNYTTTKDTQNIYVILYLLPNDDEQRRTRSSTDGIFNENFHFLLKSDQLLKRTLRLTAYKVDLNTRIRQIIGHSFIKFDKFIDENKIDKTFSTNTLLEYLAQDLNVRSDYLGEVILTSSYLKDQNLIQIRIQQINQLHIVQSKFKTPLNAHFSGQTSSIYNKYHWAATPSFMIPSSSSFIIDQTLQLPAYSSLILANDNQVECHLQLHIHNSNQIHSHARWKHSLRSTIPHTYTVSLVAS